MHIKLPLCWVVLAAAVRLSREDGIQLGLVSCVLVLRITARQMTSVKCVQKGEQRRKRAGHCTLSSAPPAGHTNDGTRAHGRLMLQPRGVSCRTGLKIGGEVLVAVSITCGSLGGGVLPLGVMGGDLHPRPLSIPGRRILPEARHGTARL